MIFHIARLWNKVPADFLSQVSLASNDSRLQHRSPALACLWKLLTRHLSGNPCFRFFTRTCLNNKNTVLAVFLSVLGDRDGNG